MRRNKRDECVTYLVLKAMMKRNRRYKLMCNIYLSLLTLDEQRNKRDKLVIYLVF